MKSGDFAGVEIWYEVHKFTIELCVPTDFDHFDTLPYTMITIPDSIIVVPVYISSERVDIIPKNGTFNRIALFFDIISTLPLELAAGVLMMLSDIVIIVYCKVSEWSKSVGAYILIVNSCTSYQISTLTKCSIFTVFTRVHG